jgi:hypothetical protein
MTTHPARTALVIRANGNGVEKIDIVPNTGLASLQEAVGGYIEAVRLGNDAIMYINEEGLLQGLPRNGVATEMYHQFYPSILRQEIVGDVIICGVDPETGEERDYPEILGEEAAFIAAGHNPDPDPEEEIDGFIERWSDW